MIVNLSVLASFIFSAAIFGFFYAWICSTMWGLDNADPRTAIAAIQTKNASLRYAVFSRRFSDTIGATGYQLSCMAHAAE
ncbi:MAG: hypothetical protein ACR2PF_08285 [Rhizobiaceae bacterium]